MKIILIVLALCACASGIQIRSQEVEDDYPTDYSETTDSNSDSHSYAPLVNQTDSTDYSESTTNSSYTAYSPNGIHGSAKSSSSFCPQCLYDHKKYRINTGCPSRKPPKCDKGTLVLTSVGDDYEMCCCNYSNFM